MKFGSTSSYIASDDLSVAVNAAITLQRPLLVKGEPGTGKTELARQVAESLGLPMMEWNIKSTTKAQQGLYEYDAVSRLRDSQLGDERVHDVRNYIRKGKLWQAFEAERPFLVAYAGRFDGFHATPASVSKTCLVRFDNNRYSVAASAVGRPVEVRAYADRIELRQDGRVVGDHPRAFGRDQTVFDPWHYVPVLARKPGALRNGAPFKNWVLPSGIDRVRRKLAGVDDGDRQMVTILTAVLSDGLAAVEAACQEALREGVHSADVIVNILARQREPTAVVTVITSDALKLRHEPAADCARYDTLRRAV